MQKSVRLLIAAALIGFGIWGWRVCFPSPEKVIRTRLSQLAAAASFGPQQGMMARAYQVQKIPGFFTPDAVINLEVRGYEAQTLSGQDELQSEALKLTRLDGLKVEFLDVSVTFGADKRTAVANLALKATVAGQRDFLAQEFDFMFKNVDGKWLIYRVETVQTLARSHPRISQRTATTQNGARDSVQGMKYFG